MNRNTASPGRLLRFASALTMAVIVPLTMATGCPFKAEEFQRHCATDSDCGDDNECTVDKCVDTVCENSPKAKETACGAGSASVCDGDGKCVECVTSADCAANHPMKPICDTRDQTCVSCTDGVKNGKETDVDCGGPDCGACLAKPCDPSKGAAACGNNTFCSPLDNICCSTACIGKCEACVEAKTGQPNGTCAPIPLGTDPDKECEGLGSCGATPGKCRCEDGVKNADESDVDCGGATCARCGGGKTCGGDGDCAVDFPACVDGACCNSICAQGCRQCNTVGLCVDVAPGTPDPTCTATQACGPNGAGCIGKAGTTCSSGFLCLSGVCTASKCAKSQLGKPCSDDTDCAMGTCQGYICQ